MAPEPTGEQRAPAGGKLDVAVFRLVLFVNGATVSSARAIRQVHAICEQQLAGRCTLRIVDVQHEPDQMPDRVLAVPALLCERLAGDRVVVGNFSDAQRVLTTLGIPADLPSRAWKHG